MSVALVAPLARLVRRRPAPVARGGAAPAVVRKRGAMAALLGPVGVAAGLVVVGLPAIAIWNIRTASDARNAVHEAPAPRDDTAVTTAATRRVADGEVEFTLRLVDGKLVSVIAGRDATTAFLNETILSLETARASAKAGAAAGLDRVFAEVFATRGADISAYADWFYGWGRSWRLLYEAVAGAVEEAVRLSFSQTQITDAARHAAEAYLLRHYQYYVLKPELRDDAVAVGARAALADARLAYLSALAGLDEKMQAFLVNETRAATELDARSLTVAVDWDAAKWRAPTGMIEDRYLEPVVSAAMIGGGAMLGGMVQRAVLPFFARATAQVMVSAEMTLGGAAAGSVSPGIGTAIGALAGAALDWGLSEFREYMERDQFVADNEAALDATIAAWKARIAPEMDRAVDIWFDDARAIVATQAKAIAAGAE